MNTIMSSPNVVKHTLIPGDENRANETASRAVSKVMWRIIPFAMLLYIFNYLDRVNISFAKLQMNSGLGFSDAVYGLGASIFFVGYFLFELPSNIVMQRVGARIWIARIMISWGAVSVAMIFVKDATSFYVLRFLLGVAEAGFFPGIILYLTYWIPAGQRARAGAWFITSLALAGVLGGPVAGALLGIHALGLAGWQWLFLLEGIPTVLLGVLVLAVLPNGPEQASWLSPDERKSLLDVVHAEQEAQRPDAHLLRVGLTNPTVWFMALIYGFILFGFYGLGFWTPSIIKLVSNGSNFVVGWLSAIPFAAAIIGMIFIGAVADRTGSRLAVVILSLFLGAAGMVCCAFCSSTFGTIFFLSVAAIGVYGALAPFWTVPPTILRGSAVAAGIAIINSIGNLGGGLIGPNVIAHLRGQSHSYALGLITTAAVLAVAGTLTILLAARLKAEGAKRT
jgi:ACS family tartrate transporter-like MFS transporter